MLLYFVRKNSFRPCQRLNNAFPARPIIPALNIMNLISVGDWGAHMNWPRGTRKMKRLIGERVVPVLIQPWPDTTERRRID